jgi:nitroreductase
MKSVLELLKNRRSTVLFSEKRISAENLEELFEAARWTPSSMNEQPWRFIYVTRDDREYREWLGCLSEKNREWAQHAYVLLLTVAHVISDYNGKENVYAIHDTAMSFAYLTMQAISADLSVHPMGGFDKEKIRLIASIPKDCIPMTITAIGYKSESEDFPDHLKKRENSVRHRKEIDEFVFRRQFGKK